MNSRRTVWIFVASFWALFGVVTGIQVWLSMITHGHSIPRLVGYNVLIWEFWLVVTAVIVRLARRFPLVPRSRVNALIHFLAATSIAIIHGFYWLALMLLIKPYDRMTAEASQLDVSEILFARLPLEWMLYCLVLGAASALEYYDRYRERELEAAQLKTALAASQLHALELQLQPHFLFNTLNSVSSLVRNGRNDEAVRMIAGLSDLLRYTLDHAGGQQVALEQEIAILRRYLEIQQVRFSDRLSFDIDVAPDAGRGAVPTLLLQPLAENAIRHGIALSTSPGRVELQATREGPFLWIKLFNSGTIAPQWQPGIGLQNSLDRLRHLYGDQALFELTGSATGVLASIRIPWSEVP